MSPDFASVQENRQPAPLTPEQVTRATRTVRAHARDDGEAVVFLHMLGLVAA